MLLTHLNAIAFFAGFALVGYGISRWSLPAAFVTCGFSLMMLAAWPYIRWPRAIVTRDRLRDLVGLGCSLLAMALCLLHIAGRW